MSICIPDLIKKAEVYYKKRTAVDELIGVANILGADAVRTAHKSRSSHLGSCLSMGDILACLYWNVLRIDPEHPDWQERDRFILSKGHGSAIVYVALSERGFCACDAISGKPDG